MSYPKLIENLIVNFSKLPGVGRRSAERMAFWFLDHPREEANALSKSITDLKENLMFCRVCNHLSDTEVCPVCSDTTRDDSVICVVEDPKDVIAIEKTGAFRGRYHVLMGSISPGDGRGPESLKIHQLIQRVATPEVQEVIIATDADNEGEMTALYLVKKLATFHVKVSRIGLGLPMGSAVEYADISTLSMSLSARREVKVTDSSSVR